MFATDYRSHSASWEERATVRSRPRREIENDGLQFYPVARQPLCTHPLVSALGDHVQEFILLQSLYKYINDIIIFETEIVNHTARRIAKGRFGFDFPFACRYDAMSVVVDEDYHAYVAMDYFDQVQRATGVPALVLPGAIELSHAIPAALDALPASCRDGMELLAVAISENTVTAEVAAFSKDTTLKRSVKGMMADHLADEGRHAVFWINLVKLYWRGVDEDTRLQLGAALPLFLRAYLTNEIQADFDRRIIDALDMHEASRAQVRDDLVSAYPITKHHPIVANIVKFFRLSGLLDHAPTRAQLHAYL